MLFAGHSKLREGVGMHSWALEFGRRVDTRWWMGMIRRVGLNAQHRLRHWSVCERRCAGRLVARQ